MSDQYIKEVLREFAENKYNNEDRLEKRKQTLRDKIPEFKKIEQQIGDLGLEMTRLCFKENFNINQYKENLQNLIDRKNAILKHYKVPENYLEMEYNCKKCKDTGFLENGSKCVCLKQKLNSHAYKMANMEKLIEKDNFDSFNLNIFSNTLDSKHKITPKKNMENLQYKIINYIGNFKSKTATSKDKNLYFFGSPGTGKTFMCSCIAKELINEGFDVIYQTAPNLMNVIEKYKFNKGEHSNSKEKLYNNLTTCDLLIIDDLGTELISSFSNSSIFNIINTRLNLDKHTIISTNLHPLEFNNFYEERLTSRIVGNYTIYEFFGEDKRYL